MHISLPGSDETRAGTLRGHLISRVRPARRCLEQAGLSIQ